MKGYIQFTPPCLCDPTKKNGLNTLGPPPTKKRNFVGFTYWSPHVTSINSGASPLLKKKDPKVLHGKPKKLSCAVLNFPRATLANGELYMTIFWFSVKSSWVLFFEKGGGRVYRSKEGGGPLSKSDKISFLWGRAL